MPNEIFIYDQIGGDFWSEGVTAKRVIAELKQFGDEDVTLRINSPGGSVFEGMAIYNAIKQYKGKVTTQIDSLAASAASVIALAADEIVMGEGSFLMIHEAWGVGIGTADDMIATASLLEKVDGEILSIYQARTGIETEELQEMVKAETWLTADEAIEKGFADRVIETSKKKKPKKANNQILQHFKHTPAALLQDEQPEPEPKQEKEDYSALIAEMDGLFIA